MRWLLLVAGVCAGCSGSSGETDTTSSTGGLTEGTGSESGGPTTTTATASDPTTTSASATTEDATSGATGTGTTGGTSDPTTGASSEATSTDTTMGVTDTGDTSDTTDPSGEPIGGCGKVPDVSGSTMQKITAAGMERDYILSMPDDYDPSKAYPLVFAWHGRGGNGALAQLYYKIEEASQGEAIFVYPDGLPLADMANQTGWDLDPNNEDFALFDALFSEVQSRLCIDPDRIFSTGHSFGGYMSNQIGCHRGDVVRAIGVVASGGPFGACKGDVADWVAHGTLDMVVPFSEGKNSRDHWTEANSCSATADPVDPAPCTAFTGCADGQPVVWCEHSEAGFSGHGWPTWAGPGIWAFLAQF